MDYLYFDTHCIIYIYVYSSDLFRSTTSWTVNHSLIAIHSKNTRVSVTRKRVHWGQTGQLSADLGQIDPALGHTPRQVDWFPGHRWPGMEFVPQWSLSVSISDPGVFRVYHAMQTSTFKEHLPYTLLHTNENPFYHGTQRNFEWIIHSIYGVKKFHSLRSEFHSILTPLEWKFTTQRVESRPVHSIFTPKEVITDVTTQEVSSVTNRVRIYYILLRVM